MGYWTDSSTWLLILGTLFILLILYVDRKVKFWKNNGITSPVTGFGTFLKHIYHIIAKPLHISQVEMYKKYGPVYGINLGTSLHLVVADPELIKNILVKDFNKFRNRLKFQCGEPTFDKMLTSLEDEDWKRVRCIISPTFSSSRMRKMAYLVRECTENFIKHIEKVTDKNGTIDCKRYFNHFTVDIVASTAFGTKLDSLDDPNSEFVRNARGLTTDSNILLMVLLSIPYAMRLLSLDMFGAKTFRYFRDFAFHVIKQRDQNNFRGNDFLQLMIDAQRGVLEKTQDDVQEEIKDTGRQTIEILPKHKTMSLDEVLSQCTLFLLAGNDTTAISLALFSYNMALYPECQEKLIKEVDTTWEKNEEINFDVLSKMTYLDAVLNESFRIIPIAVQIMRECNEEYELGDTGFKVPKGMRVFIPVYAMHHDPDFFPNPELFDPERFMPENRSSIPQYAYLPFGDGPRNCIGMRFAMMVLKMCIVHIFRHFRIHATEETKKPLVFHQGQGIMKPKEVIVRFEKRKL